jgi:hypothetical protein
MNSKYAVTDLPEDHEAQYARLLESCIQHLLQERILPSIKLHHLQQPISRTRSAAAAAVCNLLFVYFFLFSRPRSTVFLTLLTSCCRNVIRSKVQHLYALDQFVHDAYSLVCPLDEISTQLRLLGS